MKKICNELNLLSDQGNIVRLPFLVKGEIKAPPKVDEAEIEEAFKTRGEDATYVKLNEAQVVREPEIDRKSMTYTGEYIYQVMPLIDPNELMEFNIDKLVDGLYAIPFSEVLSYLASLVEVFARDRDLVVQVREMSRKT
ncbi:MAG: hypothetical protein GY864_02620, partial [Desulfobacterales bacterium]|nr:hypothetical protein [Desulfobacterales bacterium]